MLLNPAHQPHQQAAKLRMPEGEAAPMPAPVHNGDDAALEGNSSAFMLEHKEADKRGEEEGYLLG